MEEKLALYAHLAQSAEDIRLGRVKSIDSVIDKINQEIDALDL